MGILINMRTKTQYEINKWTDRQTYAYSPYSGSNDIKLNEQRLLELIKANKSIIGDEYKLILMGDTEGEAPLTTLLHVALMYGFKEVTQEILKSNFIGTLINKKGGRWDETPLYTESSYGEDDPQLIKDLLTCGAEVNEPNNKGVTPLHCAAFKGKPSSMELLLAYKANVMAVDKEGNTPLHTAVYSSGTDDMIKSLLDHNADVNAVNIKEETALHYVSSRMGAPIIKLLIDRGANINAVDNKGQTPLHAALLKCWHQEIINSLMAEGSHNVITTDKDSCEWLLERLKRGQVYSRSIYGQLTIKLTDIQEGKELEDFKAHLIRNYPDLKLRGNRHIKIKSTVKIRTREAHEPSAEINNSSTSSRYNSVEIASTLTSQSPEFSEEESKEGERNEPSKVEKDEELPGNKPVTTFEDKKINVEALKSVEIERQASSSSQG